MEELTFGTILKWEGLGFPRSYGEGFHWDRALTNAELEELHIIGAEGLEAM